MARVQWKILDTLRIDRRNLCSEVRHAWLENPPYIFASLASLRELMSLLRVPASPREQEGRMMIRPYGLRSRCPLRLCGDPRSSAWVENPPYDPGLMIDYR